MVAGLVVAILSYFAVFTYLRSRRWWWYHGLGGDFDAIPKAGTDLHWAVSVKVKGNVLGVSGRNAEGVTFTGQIILSDELRGSGRGHYYRDENRHAYGFHEVQVVDNNTILVHETFAHPRDRRAVVSGYVWERIGRR